MKATNKAENVNTFVKISRWCQHHGKLTILLWLIIAIAGFISISVSSNKFSFSFDLPGQPAFIANQKIINKTNTGGNFDPLIIVSHIKNNGSFKDSINSNKLGELTNLIQQSLPKSRAVSFSTNQNTSLLSKDGHTAVILIYPQIMHGPDPYVAAIPTLKHELNKSSSKNITNYLTGQTILASGGTNGSKSILFETIIAGMAALVILIYVFRSFLAMLPLLIAVISIPTAFLVIGIVAQFTSISTLVENIIALIGLGIGIDYALLITTRWREEISLGNDPQKAIDNAMAHAGESVFFSGTTVAVSLAALILTPFPFLRSIGLAGLLVALAGVAVSLTLLPVILNKSGSKLAWPNKAPSFESNLWKSIGQKVVAQPLIAAGFALLVLVILALPFASIHLGEPSAAAVALTAPQESKTAIDLLNSSGIGVGVLRPAELLLQNSKDSHKITVTGLASQKTYSNSNTTVVDYWSYSDANSSQAVNQRKILVSQAANVHGEVGGGSTQDDNEIHALYGKNLLIVGAVIVVVTFLLLARALKSMLLPVKALLLNIISLAAAFGVLTFIWQQGHFTNSLFGSPGVGAITIWVPLAVFSLLFGLSMDYEVFLLTRIEEEYAISKNTKKATVKALSRTGRLITSGSIILFFTFVALGGVPVVDVKILSTGLAVGIIIDATIVRGVLAPALVALFNKANWWIPTFLKKLLFIQ